LDCDKSIEYLLGTVVETMAKRIAELEITKKILEIIFRYYDDLKFR